MACGCATSAADDGAEAGAAACPAAACPADRSACPEVVAGVAIGVAAGGADCDASGAAACCATALSDASKAAVNIHFEVRMTLISKFPRSGFADQLRPFNCDESKFDSSGCF
jgi:hypothetical protein